MRPHGLWTAAALLALAAPAGAQEAGPRRPPVPLPVHEPEQVTAEAEPVVDLAVSADGRWLAYASGPPGSRDLWLRSADPNVVVLPRRLTAAPGDESAPAFAPDGRQLAYVGTAHDARGDLFLLALDPEGLPSGEPARVTGREAADGGPAFAPDGRTLYFHRTPTAEGQPRLAALDLRERAGTVRDLGAGEGTHPVPSQDGALLAFVTRRHDPGGDLFLRNLATGEERPLTSGPALDEAPTWAPDGSVVFARRGLDTDRDGWVTGRDHAVLSRVVPGAGAGPAPVQPLTPASASAGRPALAKTGDRLWFLSARAGVANVWSLPLEGAVPHRPGAEEQLALADALAARTPPDPLLAALAYHQVLARFPVAEPAAGQAAYRLARSYEAAGYPGAAEAAYGQAAGEHASVLPEAPLARVRGAALRTLTEGRGVLTVPAARRVLYRGFGEFEAVAEEHPDLAVVQARIGVERGRLLLALGRDADSLLAAVNVLGLTVERFPGQPEEAAEALFLRAEAFGRVGQADRLEAAYRVVLERYPEEAAWADRAVARLLDLATAGVAGEGLEERLGELRRLAEDSRARHPRLAMGALNRVGDLLYAAEEWARAKAAYRQVLDEFPLVATQSAAARLALAEILYREERFRQALDLYEAELRVRPEEDRIYRLARQGYIRRTVEAGEFLLRTGEVVSARSLFADLIRYDDRVVEAHRGYIKAAVALGDRETVLAAYRRRAEADPGDAVALYATGLCLTYRETRPALEEARDWLVRAIARQGQVEYFHQTLGYVFEALETVHGEKGNLEAALEAYRKAYFLNDHGANPANAANLLLNQGNAAFLLGQHRAAFQHYAQRLAADVPFDHPDTEILFYRRFGAAAFQVREPGRTVELYAKALELVRARTDPQGASRAYDALNRTVLERVLAPPTAGAQPVAGREAVARGLAERQSGLRAQLFRLTQEAVAEVPSPAWDRYRRGVEALLAEQEGVNREFVAFAARGAGKEEGERVRQTLALLSGRVRDALAAPERFVELRAELLDRLGLACQEAGLWERAAAAFRDALELNRKLGSTANLARGRRSQAYATYQLAGEKAGAERTRLLGEAAQGFREAVALVREHGVPAPRREESGGGLVNLSLDVPLDTAGATQAAFGFSAEQEERLADAFLARIALELGELDAAGAALEKQLSRYPAGQEVAEGDRFGVSLLEHRAGLLASARGEPAQAFARFGRSAELARGLGSAAAAAVNVANMARTLAELGPEDPARPALLREMEAADREAWRLLHRDPTVSRQPAAVSFHNDLGLFWLRAEPAGQAGAPVESAAERARYRARASSHFHAGLRLLGDDGALADRGRLAQAARLRLNLAAAAEALGGSGDENRERGLALAERGSLPDLAWRAVAGLGRWEEALSALETVPVLRAYAAPGEVSAALAPLVEARWQAGDPEAAFDLAERLAELERVHRLAPLHLGPLTEAERALARSAYPRLLRIRELRAAVAAAEGEEQAYRQENLARELRLLAGTLGDNRERLPALAAAEARVEAQDAVLLLLGLAAHAEDVAEAAARLRDPSEAAARWDEVRALGKRFDQLRREAVAERPEGEAPGALALLGPEPATAADLVETLPEGTTLLRAVARPGGGFLLFTLGPGEFAAEEIGDLDDLPATEALGTVLVFEFPEALPRVDGATYALSATHWLRVFRARKPFQRSLAVLGPAPRAVPAGFDAVTIPPELGADALLAAGPEAHTLWLPGPVRLQASVPTRAGEVARQTPALGLPGGRSLPLGGYLGRLPRASLALLPRVEPAAVYAAAHLLSLAGCPTVLAPAPGGGAEPGASEAFLAAYAGASARAAAGRGWALLGYGGMEPEEARAFAEARFVRYAEAAQAALQAGRGLEALRGAEDALLVARESAALGRYLGDLHRFAREAAWAAGRFADAERHAAALAEQVEAERPDSDAHAEALLRLGLVQARREAYGRAVPTLERAAEMLANLELPAEQVQALASLGVVLENATEYDRALSTFEAAAGLSRELGQEDLLAAQHASLGRLYDLRLSQWARAKQSYERALELRDAAGDLRGVIQSLIDLGRCDRLLGNFPAAEERFALALELLADEPDPILRAKAVIEQANNAWFQARYQDAFDLQRQAYALARENGWDLGQVISLNTSGLTWWTLGDHDRALRELERALGLARELAVRDDEVATTLNNIGLVYREMGRFDEALATLEQALAMDRKLQSRWAVAYDLRNLGLTHLRRGDPARALPLLREAAAEAGAIGDRVNEAKAWLALGEALAASAQGAGAGEAEGAFRQALELARSMALQEVEWRALHGLARLERAAGRLDRARDLLSQGVEVVEGMRAAIKLEQLRDGFLTDKVAVYQDLVGVLVALGDESVAFAVAERSRSRNFIDLLGNQRLTLRGAVDQELYDRELALKARMDEQRSLLAVAATEEERAAYEEALRRVQDEHRDLLLEMQARNPELASLVSVQPLDAADVQKILEPGVALLAYYLVEDEVLCWVVRSDRLTLVRTPARRAELEEAIFDYRRLIQNLEPLEVASRSLYDRLVAPAVPALDGVRTLGVIPHGSLHYLAFATLAGPRDYLADRFPLFYLPSASVLRYTLERRGRAENRRVLAIGNPDLGTVSLELPFAEQEVGAIRWRFPEVTVLTGEKATESWVTQHLGEFGIIHLASHGEFDPVNPLFSALKLAKDPEKDGDLQASEVFALEINADLVVLSACQTGLGKVTQGDDVVGLNRAFFYAGTHAVVSSLWRVSDVSTALLMKHFYREHAGRSPAESLRAAMLHVKNRYPHPGYWGAFTLSGDWE